MTETQGCLAALAMYLVFVLLFIVLWKSLGIGGSSKDNAKFLWALYRRARSRDEKLLVWALMRPMLCAGALKLAISMLSGIGGLIASAACGVNQLQEIRLLIRDLHDMFGGSETSLLENG